LENYDQRFSLKNNEPHITHHVTTYEQQPVQRIKKDIVIEFDMILLIMNAQQLLNPTVETISQSSSTQTPVSLLCL